MKGFEASTWILPLHSSRKDNRWYSHEKFLFLKISCRKIRKGSKSNYQPNSYPTWSLEVVPWNKEVKGRYRREFYARFNTKLLEDFFDDMIKTSIGKHIMFNYVFEGKLR